MKQTGFPTMMLAAALLAGSVASAPAIPLRAVPAEIAGPVVMASGDCYSVGQRIAAENGGTLATATPQTRDGQTVCVIVVLVHGQDGERPRRAEFVVPL